VLFVCENNQVGLPSTLDGHPATVGTRRATVLSTLQPLCIQVGLSTDIKDVLASDVLGSVLPRAQGYGEALPAARYVT
jgi:hypothetical protein